MAFYTDEQLSMILSADEGLRYWWKKMVNGIITQEIDDYDAWLKWTGCYSPIDHNAEQLLRHLEDIELA